MFLSILRPVTSNLEVTGFFISITFSLYKEIYEGINADYPRIITTMDHLMKRS
jgi:hypothetical protein